MDDAHFLFSVQVAHARHHWMQACTGRKLQGLLLVDGNVATDLHHLVILIEWQDGIDTVIPTVQLHQHQHTVRSLGRIEQVLQQRSIKRL